MIHFKTIHRVFYLTIILSFFQCALLQKSVKIKPQNFEYTSIAKNYFTPSNENPFPLTIYRGHNLYNSTTKDGNFLFFTTDQNGNYDIWFRDLKSSVVAPVTKHPAPEYKPAISPDGKMLAYVSEEFDSEGDIVLLKINPKKWVNEVVKGNHPEISEFEVVSNPNYEKSSLKERIVDTDPVFSPDSRYLVYVSERFTPGKPNLVSIDLKNKNLVKQLTKDGGASPFWSFDGKKILYLSFKDDRKGEIYSLDFFTGKEERLTKDEYMDFSPSLSENGRYLFYTSIRKDTNSNGRLDERDSSYIVRLDLETKAERFLSSGRSSVFDTKYSMFNGGSILFSASLHNSINIYFIPASGSVPKQENIDSQFEYALRYKTKQSYDSFMMALDSVEMYFEGDKLFPIYQSKIDLIKAVESEKSGNQKLYQSILKKMSSLKDHPDSALSYALFLSHKFAKENKSPLAGLRDYYEDLKRNPKIAKNTVASVLNLVADEELQEEDPSSALKSFKELIHDYPEYFFAKAIKRKIGALDFNSEKTIIPKEYIEIANDPSSRTEDVRSLQEDIEKKISLRRTADEKVSHVEKIISDNNLLQTSQNLSHLLFYIKASALTEANKFKESNALVDSFIGKIPSGNPLFLKTHLLKSKNFESMGSVSGSFDELRIYLENYDPTLGVELKEVEIEKSFRYYENKAAEHERIGNLREAALHYFFNTENMFLLKSKNLFLDTLYKDYAIYYQKKMIESIFKYGQKLSEEKQKGLFNKLNILGQGGVNVVGNVTGALSKLTDIKGVRSIKALGDFRDLQGYEVLGDEALKMIDLHFKQGLPRARPHLYLASLYGYAYYLINRGVIYENFYNSIGSMTNARKTSILEDFKKAEYELRWIIFADPTFSDAYQLLGWLYQYIDIVKTSKDEFSEITQEESFKEAYAKFFPEKHFEQNVELYRQILDFMGNSSNKKILSDLNLNLANNYFLLNNFPRAKDHYLAVKKMSKFIVSKAQFENYKQAALFHFNYGRTLIYLSDFESALVELKEAAQIYYKHEYYSALSKVKNSTNSDLPENQDLNEAKRKLSLLFALTGLAAMESQEYNQAIGFYKKALAMNRGIDYLENSSLFNSIGICYQKKRDFKTSDHYAKLAEKSSVVKKKGVLQKFSSFSIWNILMPDSVRVIGDGRFPGAFPPEYHNLLAKGIQIENALERNEFSRAFDLFERRKKFIVSNELSKSVAGQKILGYTNPMIATNSYLKGDYIFSHEKFLESFYIRKKEGKLQEAKRFLRDASIALFESIVSVSDVESKLAQLDGFISLYVHERSEYFESCGQRLLADNIQKNEIEKDEICEDEFYRDWYNYESLLGMLYFYKGELFRLKKEALKANYYYGLSYPYLKNPTQIELALIGLSGDPFPKKERLRVLAFLIKLYMRLGDKENFRTNLSFAQELASSGNFLEELFNLKILEAEFLLNTANGKSNLELAFKKLVEADELLESNPELVLNIHSNQLQDLQNLKKTANFHLGRYALLFSENERFLKIDFFRSTMNSNFNFEDENLSKKYFELLNLFEECDFVENKIQGQLALKNSIDQLVFRKKSIREKISEKLKLIREKFPEKKNYFDPFGKENELSTLSENDIVIRFAAEGNRVVANVITSRKKSFIVIEPTNEDIQKNIEEFFGKSSEQILQKGRLIIFPDKATSSIDFSRIKFKDKTLGELVEVQYAFLADQVFGSGRKFKRSSTNKIFAILGGKNILMAKPESDSYIQFKKKKFESEKYIPDAIDGSVDFLAKKNLFGESLQGFINLRELFEKNTRVSTVLVNNFKFSRELFEKVAFTSELFRSAGVGKIHYINEAEENINTRKKILNHEMKKSFIGTLTVFSPTFSVEKFQRGSSEFNRLVDEGWQLEEKGKLNESLIKFESALYSLDPSEKKSIFEMEILVTEIQTRISMSSEALKKYDRIIEKYKNDPENSKLILYSKTKTCLNHRLKFDCSVDYGDFSKLILSSESDLILARNLELFKKIQSADFSNLASDINIFFKDNPYEKNRHLYKELKDKLQRNLISLSDFVRHGTRNKPEIIDRNHFKIERAILTGKNPESVDLEQATDLYYYLAKNDWENFEKKIKEHFSDENDFSDSILKDYRREIFKAYKKLKTGGDVRFLFLGPEELSDGKSVIYRLSSLDRSLLFHIFEESLQNQVQGELNSLFEKILEVESLFGNTGKTTQMTIVWAEALLEKGDFTSAKKYIEKIQSENLVLNLPAEIALRFLHLKLKYFKLNKDLKLTQEENIFLRKNNSEVFALYETVGKTDIKKYIELLNQILEKKSNEKIESVSRREVIQLITYMQALAFKANNSEVFFDLGLAKDKIRSWSSRILGSKATFGKFPKFKTVSYELFKALPKNQALLSVLDFGLQTFAIKFYNGKSNGELAFKDNRLIRDSLIDYYRDVAENGNAILQKELIEERYRKSIKIDRNRITYLYLSSYHFKAPLEYREDDNFYLITSPEEVINRNPHHVSLDLAPDFAIEKKGEFSLSKDWFLKIKKLEDMEIEKSGKNNLSKAIISQEEIFLKSKKEIYFGKNPLSEISRLSKRAGNWFIPSSFLYETSFYSDDIFATLQFTDKIHYGPGVFSMGSQRDLSNVFFLKNLYKRSRAKISFKERFLHAISELKKSYPDEVHWNGYRLYTNTFLVE